MICRPAILASPSHVLLIQHFCQQSYLLRDQHFHQYPLSIPLRPVHMGMWCAEHALRCSCPGCENIFLQMRVWQICTTPLLQQHTVNQNLSVFAQTQGECCAQFGRNFTFKFVFANCAPDFSIKNYIWSIKLIY